MKLRVAMSPRRVKMRPVSDTTAPDWVEFPFARYVDDHITGDRWVVMVCTRCGAVVFQRGPHDRQWVDLHEAFHARIVEDPRYPYTVVGAPAWPPDPVAHTPGMSPGGSA